MKNSFKLILLMTVLLWPGCQNSQRPVAGEPEVITSGFQFTEGPLWHTDGFLIFSDIPAGIVYKWVPGEEESEIYLQPSGNSNGISDAGNGSLILAQHAGRISALSQDMELTPVVEEYEGKRLNSPNDVVVRSDGLIYFTDPPFGVSGEERELDFSGVYRINPDNSLTLIYDDFSLPNGIAFSPDETSLYVNDSETGQIIRFDVDEDGDVENLVRFANIGAMNEDGWGADGMKTDSEGRLYTTGPNGLIVFDDRGTQIYQRRFENQITNLAWGGGENNQLFITSHGDVYRLPINATGW
ncbi:MAG: SMP-30/gluconolactonase/LRE family protein [Balneolaceae bacterium]